MKAHHDIDFRMSLICPLLAKSFCFYGTADAFPATLYSGGAIENGVPPISMSDVLLRIVTLPLLFDLGIKELAD